jgi:hypothetical protein
MVENEQHKKQLMGVFFFFARKKGRKALADIAAAATKTIIKTYTRFLTWTTNKTHTHTHTHTPTTQKDTYTHTHKKIIGDDI